MSRLDDTHASLDEISLTLYRIHADLYQTFGEKDGYPPLLFKKVNEDLKELRMAIDKLVLG